MHSVADESDEPAFVVTNIKHRATVNKVNIPPALYHV
jgi:hypothetical protein